MTRDEIYEQAKQMLGGVPGWLKQAPDGVLQQFFTTFTWLFTETTLSARDKALVAFGAAVATHCKYCIPFHTAQSKLHGIEDEELQEAAWVVNSVAGFSAYLYGTEYDLDTFLAELEAAIAHITSQAGEG
jgi:AhpD family alkylhydroperoxidase